ncbi:MAG TPA: cytochrome P450, partial [Vicinamibacterales bacterium]|nr:cytochrome P450 [Vicinamibacterales bacterium]
MADKAPLCPGGWLLGNARALLDDPVAAITAAYRQHGPMFRLRAAWRHYTVIAGPDAGEFMARGLDKAHLTREQLFGSIAREFGKADLVLKEIGPRHARLRPPLATAYSRQVASPHVPRMLAVVREEARQWPDGQPLEVVRHAKRLAFAQYCALLGTRDLEFRDCLLMTDYLMNVAARLLPSAVFALPWYRNAHRRTYGALEALVARRHTRPPDAGPPTLVDALGAVHDPSGAPLTEDEIVSYAAYGVGASIGYVGRLTSFMLYELLRDAALYAEAVAEARAADQAGLSDAAAVRRMRVLRSVYDETLRVHSLAIGMAFDVASGFEYRGHRVDAGEFVVLSPVPSSYAPAVFTDPMRFDPARCRPPRNEHRRGDACQPFGVGDRTCAAMGLVELMCTTIVAGVLLERALVVDPPGYRLRLTVRPLPSPDRHFRCRASRWATTTDRVR